jgi:hypothetical protein
MRKLVAFALVMLLAGGALAPVARAQEKPASDKKPDTKLPWNPFEDAWPGDWSSVVLHPSGAVYTWRVVEVTHSGVTVTLESNGTALWEDPHLFRRSEMPTVEEVFGIAGITELKKSEATLKIGDRTFATTKLSFKAVPIEGAKQTGTLTLCRAASGSGLMAMNVETEQGGETQTWSAELLGFGIKSFCTFGKSPDEPHKAERSEDKAVEDAPGIYRLRGKYLVHSSAATASSVIEFPLPIVIGSEVPLRWEVKATPASRVKTWKAYERKPGDWVARVELADLAAGDSFHLDWEADVLCGPSTFEPLPADVPLEKLAEVPEEAKKWLTPTRCVQSDFARFTAISRELVGESTSLTDLTGRIVEKLRFVLAHEQGQAPDLSAIEALDKRGSCTSAANLAAALFRSCGIPARIVAGYATWYGPHQTHSIVEFYFPGRGWVPLESTWGRTPWPWSQQMHVALVYPEDENASKLRPTGAEGVPYLSVTETPGDEGALVLEGKIPDHEGCDHEAVRSHPFAAKDAGFAKTLELARTTWKDWLSLAAKGPVPEDDEAARRPLADCHDAKALRAELKKVIFRLR